MPDEVNPIYQKVKVGYERDGVRYHKCGRPWVECQQMNGEFWCEIVAASACERGDSMG